MEASVLVMKCGLSRNTFGVRIQKMRDGDWYRTWAFKLNDKLAKREGYELQSISGSLIATEDFPGCIVELIVFINVVIVIRLYAGILKILH